MFPVNWYVSNISRVPVPAKCNSEFLFCTLFVKLMLLYNKQSIFFSIYSTISKSYLDPLMDRNWELLVTELVQHLSFLGAPLFFEQSIFINLVDCSLNFPLTHRQFVVSYLEGQKGQRNTSKCQELRYWNPSWEVGFTNIMSSYCGMGLHYWTKTIMRHIGIY